MESSQSPAPEALHPQAEAPVPDQSAADAAKAPLKSRHYAYRPSHKATFIALIVVVGILAINAGIIAFIIMKGQSKVNKLAQGQVIVSQGVLNKLGVSDNPIGDQGIQLQVNPDAKFNGKVQVAGDMNIAGKLSLNQPFTAPSANFNQLQAGKVAFSDIDVNGNGTLTNLNIRDQLVVNGVTRLQGTTTVSNLFTVENSENVRGNLSVGGVLSINTLHLSSLAVDTTLSVGGHILTSGQSPSATGGGSALGSNGTVGISGNDQAGTISVNIGVGASTGTLANVTFHLPYGSTPHVVITGIGKGMGSIYVASRNANGFSVGTDTALSPGGYAIDFIVAQ